MKGLFYITGHLKDEKNVWLDLSHHLLECYKWQPGADWKHARVAWLCQTQKHKSFLHFSNTNVSYEKYEPIIIVAIQWRWPISYEYQFKILLEI